MMEQLVLHPRTKEQVVQYITMPSHAVLLVGPNGIGKSALASTLAAKVLGISSSQLTQYPYFLTIQPDNNTISIDTIRELQRFLQLKTLGSGTAIRRAVLVDHAEALTTEAQNAYLKLLEEPPADTLMVLTADSQRTLLPTILSRVQTITLYAPTESDVKAHFAASTDSTTLSQAYFLSGGLPGLMQALLDKDASHPLLEGVTQAKAVLQKQPFERLALVEQLSKKKDEAGYVLEALAHIAQTGLAQATAKADPAKLKQWHHILKITHQAQTALLRNANAKLVLTNLMLHM